ncbi:MAG: hypothetical protein RIQ68_1178 [Pseudomonadota bacterium]
MRRSLCSDTVSMFAGKLTDGGKERFTIESFFCICRSMTITDFNFKKRASLCGRFFDASSTCACFLFQNKEVLQLEIVLPRDLAMKRLRLS